MNLKSLLTNPWFQGIAALSSIASILISLQPQEMRELSFVANASPAVVVKSGATTKISVAYDGRAVTSDVTATQVAIWNAGKTSIRSENILEPVVIRTSDKCRILEATVRESSRRLCDIELDTSDCAKGELRVLWKILEKGDGALIQIVYEGSPEIQLEGSAIIEGQEQINGLISSVAFRKKSNPTSPIFKWQNLLISGTGSLWGLIVAMNLEIAITHWREKRTLEGVKGRIVLIVIISLTFGILIFRGWMHFQSLPPFQL